jgi:predicted Na+-dependent transporter
METEKTDELEAAADEAIALCGGDARAAVKALLIANAYLEDELAMAVPAIISFGSQVSTANVLAHARAHLCARLLAIREGAGGEVGSHVL